MGLMVTLRKARSPATAADARDALRRGSACESVPTIERLKRHRQRNRLFPPVNAEITCEVCGMTPDEKCGVCK
jgi:hypothetical protein